MFNVIATIAVIVGLALAYRIISACRHNWEILNTMRLYSPSDQTETVGHRHILQCQLCGKVKSTDT